MEISCSGDSWQEIRNEAVSWTRNGFSRWNILVQNGLLEQIAIVVVLHIVAKLQTPFHLRSQVPRVVGHGWRPPAWTQNIFVLSRFNFLARICFIWKFRWTCSCFFRYNFSVFVCILTCTDAIFASSSLFKQSGSPTQTVIFRRTGTISDVLFAPSTPSTKTQTNIFATSSLLKQFGSPTQAS